MILAIDIGGTFIKWAVSQGYSLTDVRGKVPTPQDSFESLVEAIARIAEALSERPEGIAVSLPGTVDAATGFIVQGGALQYANGRNLVDALRDRLGLPVIHPERCTLRCAGRTRARRARGLHGWRHGGHRHGRWGSRGERWPPGDGRDGCRRRALHACRAPLASGGHGRSSGQSRRNARSSDQGAGGPWTREPDGRGAHGLVVDGDGSQATSALDEGLADLADALLSLQFLLDPQRFVIGGGISADATYMAHLIQAYENAFATLPFQAPHAEVVPARFRNDANLLGAVVHYGTASR